MQRRTKIFGAIGGAVALAAVAVGAAATGGSPASSVAITLADPPANGAAAYPGTVATSVSVTGTTRLRAGQSQEITIEVQTAGDAEPQGQVNVVFTRQGGDYREERTLAYLGQPVAVRSSSLGQAGQYSATVTYMPPSGSVWQGSTGEFSFQVIGKGKG